MLLQKYKVPRELDEAEGVLPGKVDQYQGVTVDLAKLDTLSIPTFSQLLTASLQYWTSKGRRCVWLKIPIEQSALIPTATKHGFTVHHAQERSVVFLRIAFTLLR